MDLVLIVAHLCRHRRLLGVQVLLDLLVAFLVEETVLSANGNAERFRYLLEV